MRACRPYLPTGATLLIGIVLGWLLAGTRPAPLLANGADRRGESALITGAIATEPNNKLQIQLTNDGLYYLNYSTGRLFAAYPSLRQVTGRSQLLSEFAERDLLKDFQLEPGSAPHFLLATGTMGAYSEGWAPLYVIETTSGQVRIYRVVPQATAGANRPTIALLEQREDRRLAEHRSTRP